MASLFSVSKPSLLVLLLSFIALAPAQGQDATSARFVSTLTDMELGLGSLGLHVAPSFDLSEGLQIRPILTLGNFSTRQAVDDTHMDGELETHSLGLFVDYYPTGTGLRVSAGLTTGGYAFTSRVTSVTFEGTTYTGNLGFTLEEKNALAPSLSIGAKGGRGRVSGFFDVGVRLNTLVLSATGAETLSNQADFEEDVARINRDLDEDGPFLPSLAFGVSIAL